jgi:hypothetical protein
MSFEDHLKICSDCQKRQRPTIKVKGASAYRRERALSSLAALISGVSYPGILYAGEKTNLTYSKARINVKGASSIEKSQKLKELGKMIKDFIG